MKDKKNKGPQYSNGRSTPTQPRPRPDPQTVAVRAFGQYMTASRYFGLDEEGNRRRPRQTSEEESGSSQRRWSYPWRR